MAEQDKLYNAIGLAMRAGKCISGDFAVEKLLKKGRAKLVILDGSASDNLKKQYRDASDYYHFPMIFVENAGGAIGKAERKVLAITDENFVKLISEAAKSADGEGTTGVKAHGE